MHTPVKVGAKYNLPSFSNLRSGSVQIPTRFNLAPEPGKSFKEIEMEDLYNLYSLGLNSSATIAKPLG